MKEYLKAKKYLELYIVADNTLYKKFEEDVKRLRQRIFGIVNYINTYKKSGAVCRAVRHDCDLAEMCSGSSARCPSDRFRVNGHPCAYGEGYCYRGTCPTRDSQCKAAFGPRGDKLCGKLFCSGGREMPRDGSLVTFDSCKASFSRNGEVDPGMILDGTKCGNGMVCSNGECVYAEEIFRSTNCSAKCSGHASFKNLRSPEGPPSFTPTAKLKGFVLPQVCDHELQCQCEEGWAPPTCDSSSAFTSIAIVVGVLAVLAVTATAAVLLVRLRVAQDR
ncbi:hypothetical protein WISP_29084 [Willisornis vidua]|uniref:Peptidase M12B domain-containing protein n=1 Tax=Willisornis vidua TaxID=1566151 RepID=A0ABQ9DM02_9PASS|nr:hypothetical protein WISP_29084 [Willisornis vidua]